MIMPNRSSKLRSQPTPTDANRTQPTPTDPNRQLASVKERQDDQYGRDHASGIHCTGASLVINSSYMLYNPLLDLVKELDALDI
jgi:hypothetical protein